MTIGGTAGTPLLLGNTILPMSNSQPLSALLDVFCPSKAFGYTATYNGAAWACGSIAATMTLSGDVTGPAGLTVVRKVNGGSMPTGATVIGTNSSNQLVDASTATLSNNTTGNAATATTATTATHAQNLPADFATQSGANPAPASFSALTVTGTGCGANTIPKADASGCVPVIDLTSPGPIGSNTPNTVQVSSLNGIPAATLAYVDPTSSIQTQITNNATAISGKAASNASTSINGVTCVLSGSCTINPAALTPVGAWNASTAYVPGNLVTYTGANYSCITGCAIGVTPTTTANWMPIYGTSLSTASTWTALQTFNAGVAGTRIGLSQAAPANSAGFSNFGGAQLNAASGLNGGLTVYDNGSSRSEGVASVSVGGTFGIGIYSNWGGSASNVWLCPSASSNAYPTLITSFNCPYSFAATGMTTTLSISVGGVTSPTGRVQALQPTVANSSGFSNFGGSQNNGGSGLNGGITIYDNGSSWSEGLTRIIKGGNFGPALYSNSSSQATNIFLCPSASGAAYPTLQTSLNCPFIFSATSANFSGLALAGVSTLTTTAPVTTTQLIASQTSPADSSGFSHFGNSYSTTGLAGGMTIADTPGSYSEGMAAILQGGHYGTAIYSNHINAGFGAGTVFLCPSPASSVYPVGQASFNCPYVFTPTGATFSQSLITNGLTSNGVVTVASPSAATNPGALTLSDPIAPNQAATQVYTTLMAKVQRDFPNKAPITYSTIYHSFGDSITAGSGATTCNVGGDCYAQDVARGIGATLTNYGVVGDYSCDLAKKVFNNENPGASNNPVYTMQIGTNDLNVKGTGTYEQIYNLCQPAAASWLAVQSGFKVAGSAFTGSGWSNNTTYSQVTGTQSTTNGATATGSITTYGGPIYLWYEIIDGNGGTFTWSLNGGAASAPVNNFGPVAISTTNGVTRSVAMLRIPPPAAGVQSLVITVTSATGAGNIVSIIAMGTPQRNAYYVGPVVVIGPVPYQQFDGRSAGTGQYTLDALANQQQLAADGLDVRFANARSCMQLGMPSEMFDNYHPDPVGHQELANCYIPVLQAVPGRNVNRWTPANSAAACTQNDVWADGSYVYNCIKSGQIVRAALTSF